MLVTKRTPAGVNLSTTGVVSSIVGVILSISGDKTTPNNE